MATREQTPKALPGGLGDVATAHPWSYAASLLLVAVAYYAAAKLGLRLALVGRNITPFWPPTGIAVVAFILLGRSVWPGVALAAFAVNLPISTNGLAAAATAAGNTLAPLVAATLLSKIGFHRQIDRLRDATAIVFVGCPAQHEHQRPPLKLDWKTRWRNAIVGYPTISRDRTTRFRGGAGPNPCGAYSGHSP